MGETSIGHPGERFDYLLEKLIKPTRELLFPIIQKVVSGKVSRNGLAQVDPEFLTFILAGSISMANAMRPLIARFTKVADVDESFRQNFRQRFASRSCHRSPERFEHGCLGQVRGGPCL